MIYYNCTRNYYGLLNTKENQEDYIMPKFFPHRSGKVGKAQKQYISTYDVNLPASKLKMAGFLQDDGTVKEYRARVEHNRIILEHKDYLFAKD